MPRPDFVKWALGRLSAEWDTDSYRPRPVLIDQRDTARDSDGVRAEGGDLAANSIVSVGSQPTVTNTPVGTEFDLRYLDGINVRIEGVHESEAFPDEAGGVAGAAEFGALVNEVRRVINANRIRPTSDPRVFRAVIAEENDRSVGERDYFRVDLTVNFRGHEELP
jgi:hypothetical protein